MTPSARAASGRGCSTSSSQGRSGRARARAGRRTRPAPAVGVHERGRGPGDSFSLPYFEVDDLAAALEKVPTLGGTVIHPGERWAICKDSEGSPFGLAARST